MWNKHIIFFLTLIIAALVSDAQVQIDKDLQMVGTAGNRNITGAETVDASIGYRFNGLVGTAGQVLRSDGLNGFVAASLIASDIPNLDMSKITTGNLPWTRLSGVPATFPPSPGSGDYIQNQNAVAQSANAWISGSFRAASLGVGITPAHALDVTGHTRLTKMGSSFTIDNSGQLELSSGSGGAGPAFMSFHRPGIYGAHFGLDTDNWFSTQGWSAGSGYTPLKTGTIFIQGIADAAGNLRFATANPYIVSSSYFIAPGGAYFNNGTVFFEAASQHRGGIQNDGSNYSGRLRVHDDLEVDGTLRTTIGNGDIMLVGNDAWLTDINVGDLFQVRGNFNPTLRGGIQLGLNSGARIWGESNGRIGINTTAPDQRLSVNGDASKTGGGSWATFSEQRLKTNVSDYMEGLSLILKIRPVNYRYSTDYIRIFGHNDEVARGKIFQGVIAQELKEVAPDMVRETDILLNPDDPNSKLLSVDPSKLTWALVNAIKELQKQLDELKASNQDILRQLMNSYKEIESLRTERKYSENLMSLNASSKE